MDEGLGPDPATGPARISQPFASRIWGLLGGFSSGSVKFVVAGFWAFSWGDMEDQEDLSNLMLHAL